MTSALGTASPLAHVADTLPLLVQGLLPQRNHQGVGQSSQEQEVPGPSPYHANLVISATHSKDVARDRPAHVPDNILKGVQDPEDYRGRSQTLISQKSAILLWSPSASILLSPDDYPSILTARGERLPAWAQARKEI